MKKFGRLSPISLLLALAIAGAPLSAQTAATKGPLTPLGKAPVAATTGATLVSSLNGIQEYKLANGLTVLLKEAHTAPVAYFSVWYKAGSVDEQVGQTGMSHLLEHMMFKGTTTRKPGEISALLQQNGANFNATTSFDRTNYFETLASDRLDIAMKLEADRMKNSLFNEAEHQKEMTVVRSEYEGGENDPSTALTKAVRLAAYQVHPYRTMTIGFRSDIENINRDEMYAYYQKYYVPNNATVVMVGDFDTAAALGKVQQYFGGIARQPVTPHFITPEPPQLGERRVVVRRAGTVGQVQIAYHIPAFDTPDRYALDVLESTLSGGRTARFFSALVQSGLASDAEAYDYGLRDPDLLTLDATAQPGTTNAQLEAALLEQVEKIKTTPISDEELKRVVNQSEASYIYGRDSVQSQGAQLGEFAVRGNWKYGETYLDNIRKVTPADVQRVAQKYLTPDNRTVGYFEPIVPGAGAAQMATAAEPAGAVSLKPDAPAQMRIFTRANAQMKAPAAQTPMAQTPMAQTPMAQTPMAQPAVATTATTAKTQPTRVVLPNGLTIVVEENHANATVALSGALLSAGGVFDPAGKEGLASLTASQLSRGTQTRSLLDIARTLEGVGASVSVSGGEEYVSLGGRSLSRDFGTMLSVLADELRNPSFPTDELEKSRQQTLAALTEARQDTGTLGQIAFMNALYPVGHPYHMPTLDEQTATIKNVNREDLVKFHADHYAPDKMILTIVGDVKTADAVAAITKAFGDWPKKGNVPAINIADVPLTAGKAATANAAKPLIINVPDKAQTDVIYGYPSHLKRSDPDFYRVVVLNTILGGGGGLSSRLAVNVRDKMGLVYGIYAGTDASLGAGPFTIGFGSNPANVDKAVAETRRQLTLAQTQGFTPDEVNSAVDYLTGSYAVTLATNSSVASQLLVAEVYGLGDDYIQKRNGYYRAVTPAQVNAAAKKYLDPSLGTLVISGTVDEKKS